MIRNSSGSCSNQHPMTTGSGSWRAGRAGFSNRGGRGGRSQPWKTKISQQPPDIILHPLGRLLARIDNASLDKAASLEPRVPIITDCKSAGAYSWLNEKDPTILVPGKPALWTPPNNPCHLDEDSGDYFRDPNAAMFPEFPMEPAVRAFLSSETITQKFDIDIFACGTTMGNLLRYVRLEEQPFRFTVERIGKTIFINRKENAPDQLIEGVHGFGHTFLENYTTWGKEVRGSVTHQRIHQYQFGGLKCLVRFESDGYLEHLTSMGAADSDGASDEDDDDVSGMFQKARITLPALNKSELKIKDGGSEVPKGSIFELKTRSGRFGRSINIEHQLPRLWVRQIPNFIIAYHDGEGLFPKDKTHIRDVRQDIQRWEAENSTTLQRLAQLLHKLIDFAETERVIDVYFSATGSLEIREQFGQESHVLPLSLRQEWEDRSVTAQKASIQEAVGCDKEEKGGSSGSDDDYRNLYVDSCSDEDCDVGSNVYCM